MTDSAGKTGVQDVSIVVQAAPSSSGGGGGGGATDLASLAPLIALAVLAAGRRLRG